MAKRDIGMSLGNIMKNNADRVAGAMNKQREEESPAAEETTSQLQGSEETEAAIEKPRRRGPKSSTAGNNHVINARLDDKTYWRANAVKGMIRKERGEIVENGGTLEDDATVSISNLLRIAMIEWLDKHYPETNEKYDIVKDLGLV